MVSPHTIALDVMGGDRGPEVVIPGANLSLIRQPDIRFLLFGDEKAIRRSLERYPDLAGSHTNRALSAQAGHRF